MEPSCDPLFSAGVFLSLSGVAAFLACLWLLARGNRVLRIAFFQLKRSGQTVNFLAARVTELEAALKETGAVVPPPRDYRLDQL